MKNSRVFLAGFCLLLGVAVGVAQRPEQDISNKRHPNLAAAQRFCLQAFEKINAAQRANEWDMAGHAQRAKDLIDQAARELKEAAETANHPKK